MTTDNPLLEKLYNFACEKLTVEYPEGWGGLCVAYTDKANIFYSKYFDAISESASLCFETGAILESFTKNEKITHIISLIRNEGSDEVHVVTPCGICQERLFSFGEDLNIIYRDDRGAPLKMIALRDLNPHHWYNLYR